MSEFLFGLGGHAVDAFAVANIEFQRDSTPAERNDFFFESEQVIATAAGEDEISAGLCQCPRHVLAETAAGSGNNCYLNAKLEKIFAHDAFPGARTTFIKLGSRAF